MSNTVKKPGWKNVPITFKTTPELKRIIETICYEERITATYLIETLINRYNNSRNRVKRNKDSETVGESFN
ncbi:MAG TPA: hypothetical protein VN854_00055 [Mycoplasmatales bacterium]|nr:hypothetical protein [Mycoplasmatales bacterium]